MADATDYYITSTNVGDSTIHLKVYYKCFAIYSVIGDIGEVTSSSASEPFGFKAEAADKIEKFDGQNSTGSSGE
jgi:hypothetical protein